MTAYRRKMLKPPPHIAAQLSARTLTDRQTSGFAYLRLIGAIQTLKAERDIKRDTLSKLCKGWFE